MRTHWIKFICYLLILFDSERCSKNPVNGRTQPIQPSRHPSNRPFECMQWNPHFKRGTPLHEICKNASPFQILTYFDSSWVLRTHWIKFICYLLILFDSERCSDKKSGQWKATLWVGYTVGGLHCGEATLCGGYTVGKLHCGEATFWGGYTVGRLRCG